MFLLALFGHAQKNISIDAYLKKWNSNTVPYITIKQLLHSKNLFLLDARERKEYETSKIRNATFAGYKSFKFKKIKPLLPHKQDSIVVYCSIGVRSEDIAEKLIQKGYTNVFNLYGGIFKWKNNNLPLRNNKNKLTDTIHAFDKNWAKLLKKGTKIYD